MDTEAVIINGRTYVPLRFVSEALGYKVDYRYERGYHRIDITSPEKQNEETSDSNEEDVTVIDIENLKAPHYTHPSGKMSIYDYLGICDNSVIGKRPENSTLEDDIKHFNETAFKGTGWKFTKEGYLTYSTLPDDAAPQDSIVILDRDPQTKVPIIQIRQWRMAEGEENFTRVTVSFLTII